MADNSLEGWFPVVKRKTAKGRPHRFPLLVYRQLFKMWFWPSVLLTAASGLLLWERPAVLGVWVWAFVPLLLVTLGLAAFSLLARTTAYVMPHPEGLRIVTPFFRLVVSYGRVNIVRTTQFKAEFPPGELSWSLRKQAEKLYGQPCIVVELMGYPLPKRTITFFLNDLMLSHKGEGLVLLVQDWLALSNAIEGARGEWVTRRMTRRQERTVEKVLRN
jgi:hypothetical protein